MDIFEGFSGQFRFIYGNFLLLLSNMQESPLDVLKELTDNTLDAGGTTVSVSVTQDEIIVIDNGHGMNPYILPADMDELHNHWERLARHEVEPDFDVRKLISPASKASLGWMALNVAFSGKTPQPGERITGTRGIGFQNVRQIAGSVELLSRPSPDIAAGNRDTYRMVLQTVEDLRLGRVSPLIEKVDTQLRDYAGKPLDYGTVVMLRGLKQGVQQSVRPNALIAYLRDKYGARIKDGLRMVVVDHVTEEGKRATPHGVVSIVPAPSYKGYPVLKKTLYLTGGKAPFEVEFWFDPNGKGLRPRLWRKETDVRALTDLDEFQTPFFMSGRINGHAPWADVPETDAPWDTRKVTPLPGPVRNQWSKAILAAVPEAEARIKEIEDRARADKLNESVQAVADATLEAMRDLDAFQGITIESQPPRTPGQKGKKRKKGPHTPNDRVLVNVLDEHNLGVSDIPVQLLQGANLASVRTTGISGKISFGKPGDGRYTAVVELPSGVIPVDGATRVTFNIGPNQPGVSLMFKVITGRPKPADKRVRRLMMYVHPLSDSDQAYSAARLDAGLFEINSEHVEYAMALEVGDSGKLDILTALYTAAGVTEYALHDQPPAAQLHNASLLAARAISLVNERRRTRRS